MGDSLSHLDDLLTCKDRSILVDIVDIVDIVQFRRTGRIGRP